jgi:uncharacterized protein YndB with AHSA1/START domain
MSSSIRGPKAVADVSAGAIVATVDIRVPPERVFAALSTREVVDWWGDPSMYRTTAWQSDVRVGGPWRASGIASDGSPFSVGGTYLEVDPPRKLVQTWNPDWDDLPETRITYLLEAIEGGTRLTLRHEGFGPAHRESCSRHGDGWERVLGWLLRHFPQGADAPADRYWFYRLVPPRPSFAFDMSEHEREVMGRHADYWRAQLAAGTAVVFGPVNDPAGPWGLGVMRAKDEHEMAALRDGDPAVGGDIGMRCDVLPMLSALVRP